MLTRFANTKLGKTDKNKSRNKKLKDTRRFAMVVQSVGETLLHKNAQETDAYFEDFEKLCHLEKFA